MLDTPEAVVEALRENHDRPHGLPRTVTAEDLVEAAEAFEQQDVLVTALLELMTAYEFTGEHRKSPVTFARLLKLWDTDRALFSEGEGHQVFWRFKWVTTSLLEVPEMPLATVHGWIDRMRERYEEADHGLQPVAAMRHRVAEHTGTGAADAYDLWATRPRTGLSDCEACEIRQHARHQAERGDDTAALDTWRPVLEGLQSCEEEPQASQARALLPLLRSGRTDEARSHHLTGYRKVRGRTGTQEEVGLHLEFCALSRNEGRGLEILAENRSLFEATAAPLSHLGFLSGVEVLLARLTGADHDDTAVAGPPGRTWTAAGLLAHVRTEADALAAAFDARNGTPAVGDARRARLDRRPLLDEPLPLGLRAVTSGLAPVAARAASVEIPEDFGTLVREARRLAREGNPGQDRLWKKIGERLAEDPAVAGDETGPVELLHAEIAEQRAHDLWREGQRDERAAVLADTIERFEHLRMPWHALSGRALLLVGTTPRSTADSEGDSAADLGADSAVGGAPADWTEVREALSDLLSTTEKLLVDVPLDGEALGEGEAAYGADLRVERTLAYLAVRFCATSLAYRELLDAPGRTGDGGEEAADGAAVPPAPDAEDLPRRFEEHATALHAEAERLGHPHQAANAHQFRAELAWRSGDLTGAERELRTALEMIEAAGRPWRRPRPSALLAQVLLGRERPQEAVELLHGALADAVAHDDTTFAYSSTYMLLGHASTHLGDPSGAVRHLSEAAARFDQEGVARGATEARLQLADVLSRSGQRADAVAVLESVLADEETAGLDERTLAQARLDFGRGLRDLEEYLPAAEQFLALADTVADWPDQDRPVLTLVAAEAATALALADRWDAATTVYERAVAAHAEAPNPPQIVLMMREFARLTVLAHEAEGVDTALGHLARADAVLAAVPDADGFADWFERGEVHYRRARVLSVAERFEEALPEAEAAVAAHEEGGADGELPRAEAVRLAALIEGNGLERVDAAVVRLTEAAARCRGTGHEEAADVLDTLCRQFRAR
ncbi:hypothetical protein ACIRQY_23610 [Streptomyces sp. NPDC101490]|uniref:hypothetical protein n=1 Tax=Streptomyces sp. NPDC101490 TaxID=3366143 RepID=UPI00381138B9